MMTFCNLFMERPS